MIELVAATAIVYFVYSSWNVYTGAANKLKAATSKKSQGLSDQELAKLKQLLNQQ